MYKRQELYSLNDNKDVKQLIYTLVSNFIHYKRHIVQREVRSLCAITVSDMKPSDKRII